MPVTPKYRRLTIEELQELEKEFIDFLIVNGIAADDWGMMKQKDAQKAEDILTLFSDVIFEGVMRKVRFLEKQMPNELMTFQCLKDRIILVAISSPTADFTNSSYLEKAIGSPPADAKVYTTEKKYHKTRELELFEMIESGCTVSDGKLFKTLSLAL